ncbi:response regulator transcription factor [Pediococcus cellicola]|nr:response regulator transcription factor [Pediococcus cellicola]GEL15314.1 hypothetical protein PCE01_11160 [Pediococcus cellicola]
MVRVMIVDDHPIYRDCLKTVFADKKDFTIVAEAENENAALQLLSSD